MFVQVTIKRGGEKEERRFGRKISVKDASSEVCKIVRERCSSAGAEICRVPGIHNFATKKLAEFLNFTQFFYC